MCDELETSRYLLSDHDLMILSVVEFFRDHPIQQSYHNLTVEEKEKMAEETVTFTECKDAMEATMQQSCAANLYNTAVANGYPEISPKVLPIGWAMKGNEGNTHRNVEVRLLWYKLLLF